MLFLEVSFKKKKTARSGLSAFQKGNGLDEKVLCMKHASL